MTTKTPAGNKTVQRRRIDTWIKGADGQWRGVGGQGGTVAAKRMRRVVALLLVTCGALALPAQAPSASTLIINATIIDGTGTARRSGAVRVVGDRIVATGALSPQQGETVVDAHGLVLAPGFIDTHSHHERSLREKRDARAVVSQGITTIVAGQDGGGINLAERFARIEQEPPAVNVASYAGHGAIRDSVLGVDFKRTATPAEVARMKALLRAEMDAGALGLSTGLEYDPGIYSSRDEVLELAKVAAAGGGRYVSHIRSEDRDFWNALAEIINIGRVTRMPVQVSHLKLGMMDLWGQADSVLRMLNRARAAGVRITADVYPWTYWSSNLGVFYPKRNFADSAETAFVLAHLSPADGIIFDDVTGHADYAGKTLADIAAGRGVPPWRAMMDLLAEKDGPDAGIVARGMDDRDVETLTAWPWANVCSDGTTDGGHPRGWGSFPRVLGRFVRDKQLFSLEEGVRKMTSLSAANVGLVRRGRIAPGYYADLVLFDPATVVERATFSAPHEPSVGITTVWVNGVVVFDAGATTNRHPGRALRRAGTAQR